MILKPYSIANQFGNTVLLQSTDYETSFPRASANLQLQTNPSYVKRAGTVPLYAGKDFQPVALQLEILCKHDFMTLFESVNQIFDTKDETPRLFVCQDTEDTSAENPKQYYIYVTAKQVLGGHDGNMAVVTLAVDDPIWQSVTQNSMTFSVTDSTGSTDVTANGNDYSYPTFEITPSLQSSTDYLYNMYVQVLPTSTDPYPNRFLDLTGTTDGTTWDTAALIAAGKMQSAGQDIRVFRDGVEVDYWLNGINTTDTHVIVACDMPEVRNMTLKTALASSDTITEIELNYTTNIKNKISALPGSGRLILDASLGSTDTEEFTYTAKIITATKLAFTINARSCRGTAAFNHAANCNVRFLPYDFNIVYGNSSVAAFVTDDTHKPIQALTSRNNSFSFVNFFDEAGTRPGIWTPLARKVSSPIDSRSDVYKSTDDEGDVDPATAMGIGTYTYQALGAWKADTVFLGWLGYFPDGIASVGAVSGAQNQSSANRPASNVLQAGPDGAVFTTLWSVAAQASTDYGAWTTWSKASSDATIPTGAKYLRWKVSGTQLGSTDVSSKVEISAITVGISNPPHVMLRAEAANYKLDCTITNTTTGESFRVLHQMALNETLIIDCDPNFPTAKYKGVLVNGAIFLSSVRPYWLRLRPGSNTIAYETNLAGASSLAIVVKHRDSANFL